MSKLAHAAGKTAIRLFKAPFSINSYALLGEQFLLRKQYQCMAPQLFIMGLPRSGTTLIYQYIAHRLNVSYFTHGVGRFPYAPCLSSFIQHRKHGQYQSAFENSYGKESGTVSPVAPREAGGWWGRFFHLNNYVTVDDLTEKDIHLLQNTIICIQNSFGGIPFVNKNVKHLLRIGVLGKIFPNSRFLIVERDVSDVAISIMRGRHKNLPDPTQWWSVRPPNYKELGNLSITEQVANQCISLKQKMEHDLSKLPSEKVMRIHYEDFCKNPERLVDKLALYIAASKTKNPAQQSFKMSHAIPQTPEESDLIKLAGKLDNEQPEEIL